MHESAIQTHSFHKTERKKQKRWGMEKNPTNNATEVHTLLDLPDTNGVASLSRTVTCVGQGVCVQTVYLIISKEEGI
jgi:hypothetical protein